MKPIPGSFPSWMKLSTSMRSSLTGKFYMLFLVLFLMTSGLFAQTVTWSESYEQGLAPTPEQHQRWNDFLASLKDKKFASVTLSGTFDETGKTLSDPVAVEQLATLLNTGTAGSVEANGQTWTVTNCDTGNGVFGIGLKVDGVGTSCLCGDLYALRPLALNDDWGGVNSPPSSEGSSCAVRSQTLKLVFYSGVTVVAQGPTELCEGGTVVLKAQSDMCSGPLTYLWSTNETTESIIVSQPGTYSVTVSDGNNCGGTSAPFAVNYAETHVNIQVGGVDVTEVPYSDQPVQLNAIGTSVGGKAMTTETKFCLFDAPGGSGDCQYAPAPDYYICGEGLTEFTETKTFEVTTTLENPVELKYNIYHSAWFQAKINLKLNGQTIEVYDDPNPPGECYDILPTTVSVPESKLKGLWQPGSNTLAMEVIGADKFFIANLSVEVVTSNVSYNWTPAEGLSFATIANPEASPLTTETYTVTFTDGNGCKANDQVKILVLDGEVPSMPIAQCKPHSVNLTTSCEATVAAIDFDNGSTSPSGLPLTYSISPAGPFGVGTWDVTFTVTDSNDKSSSCMTTLTVVDATTPAIPALPELTYISDAGLCSATVVLPLPAASDNCAISIVNDQQDNVFEVGSHTVTWTVTDASGNKQTATQLVTVTNPSPVFSSVVGPIAAVAVGTNAVLAITYTDDNLSHATIDWGDGSAAAVLSTSILSFEVGHAYTIAGTYAVNITLTDKCGGEASMVYESISVFDPRSGSVSGGGWFDSPPGADRRNPAAEGRANFSFDASYNGFSNIPQGSASFTFRTGNIKFKSSEFDLLLIDGQTARLTGTGTVNGKNGYSILIAMVDDDSNRFGGKNNKKKLPADRIRVKVSDPAGQIIYDTQYGEPDEAIASNYIGAGSIEIDNIQFSTTLDETLAAFSFGAESTSVYPNPFIDYINVQFATESTEDIVLTIMDLTGSVIGTATYAVRADGSYTLDVPETADAGIYVLTIRQGSRIEVFTVMKN